MTMPSQDRPFIHNPSVDEAFALRGACGQTHLPTGRICVLPRGHGGSCDFVRRDHVEAVLEERVRPHQGGHS